MGALFLLMAAGLAIGCYARFAGLGRWCLATDEFYFGTAVDLWRAKGLPEFFSGNLYPRGLFVQFLATISVALFGVSEFAYRLPAVLCGLACLIPLTMLVGRRARAPGIAAAAIILLLSSWHVEFSRFARMYSALLLITLWVAVAVERGFVLDRKRWKWAALILVVFCGLVHEAQLILAAVLFAFAALSWERRRDKERLKWLVLTFVCVLLSFVWRKISLRLMHSGSPIGANTGSWFVVPDTRALALWAADPQRLIVWAVCCAGLLAHAIRQRLPLVGYLVLLPLLALQPGIATCLLFILVCARAVPHGLKDRRLKSVLVPAGAACCVLILVAAVLAESRTFITGAVDTPALYRRVIEVWVLFMPILGIAAFSALGWSILRLLRSGYRPRRDFISVFTLCLLLAVSASDASLLTPRYTYYTYPLLLLVLLTELRRLPWAFWKDAMSAGALLLLFLSSRDFSWAHLSAPDTPSANFRLGPYRSARTQWYTRHDYQTLAETADAELGSGGQLVLTNRTIATYRYVSNPAAVHVVVPPSYWTLRADGPGKWRDLWTGAPASAGESEFLANTEPNRDRVLVLHLEGGSKRRLDRRLDRQNRRLERFFVDRSGELGLFRIVDR